MLPVADMDIADLVADGLISIAMDEDSIAIKKSVSKVADTAS